MPEYRLCCDVVHQPGCKNFTGPVPDNAALREAAFDALVDYHGKSACRESTGSWEKAADALAALAAAPVSPAGLDVERLRRAVTNVDHAAPGAGWIEDVAREYAALASPEEASPDA